MLTHKGRWQTVRWLVLIVAQRVLLTSWSTSSSNIRFTASPTSVSHTLHSVLPSVLTTYSWANSSLCLLDYSKLIPLMLLDLTQSSNLQHRIHCLGIVEVSLLRTPSPQKPLRFLSPNDHNSSAQIVSVLTACTCAW